ncbi:MAG: hypothetical protein C0471_10115 [Erythrobacter sp.]|nr:hypothetical protein [Erythrobacter sp.]MBA4044758.1 hypothetical protein [Erythrobacter sp.]MBA4082683.1 hypothetical protein [Erythrobacter sp.]
MIQPMQYDREKMRAVILHAARGCDPEDLGAVKLNKILYFLDMISYANHRLPVTGATFRKRPNGPTSDQLLFALRDMERAGDIRTDTVEYHGYYKKEYHALVPAPDGILSEQELSLLSDIVDFVCRKNTAKSISEFSHKIPWEMADMGGVIQYHTAMLLFPMQPSPEAFDAAEDGMKEVEAKRSSGAPLGVRSLGAFRDSLRASIGQV